MEEIEAKFLRVNHVLLLEKLDSLGAVKEGDYHYRRKIFDYADNRLDKVGAWVRLRDEGNQITLTYKQRQGADSKALTGGTIQEIEVTVSSFEETEKILRAIGLVECTYIENKRTRYHLDGVEVDLDTWPLIPPFVEIEGSSWDEVKETAAKLGLDWTAHVTGSSRAIFKEFGFDEDEYKILTFKSQIKR